jgi:cation transport regulator
MLPNALFKELRPASWHQEALPSAAQTIFRKVFNSAHKKYKDEVIAFRVAWSAVKRKFEKSITGKWIRTC